MACSPLEVKCFCFCNCTIWTFSIVVKIINHVYINCHHDCMCHVKLIILCPRTHRPPTGCFLCSVSHFIIIIIIIIKVIGHCYNHHQSHLLSQNEPCWSASQASWASSMAWPRHWHSHKCCSHKNDTKWLGPGIGGCSHITSAAGGGGGGMANADHCWRILN